jgi:hypothetical protein
MRDQIISIFTPVLLALCTAIASLLIYLLNLAITKMKVATQNLKDEGDKRLAQTLLNHAEDIISTAVSETNQVLVDNLKKQNEDGRLSPEEMKLAFDQTYAKVNTLLGDQAKDELSLAVSDVDAWIKTKIEFYVNLNK